MIFVFLLEKSATIKGIIIIGMTFNREKSYNWEQSEGSGGRRDLRSMTSSPEPGSLLTHLFLKKTMRRKKRRMRAAPPHKPAVFSTVSLSRAARERERKCS